MPKKGGDSNQKYQTTFFKPQKQFKGLDDNYKKMEKSRTDFSSAQLENKSALVGPSSFSDELALTLTLSMLSGNCFSR